jgi:hypothetical protein
MLEMENLALKIDKGEDPEPKSYPIKIPGIGTENPMITSLGTASIVYDPEIFKQLKKVN